MVQQIARFHYDSHYKPAPPSATDISAVVSTISACIKAILTIYQTPVQGSSSDLLDIDLDVTDSGDELDAYILTPRQVSVKDPIKYWQALLPSRLAQMALDVLSAPGMSCYLKCCFMLTAS